MRQKLDLGYMQDVLKENYVSKSDMAKSLGITRSHIQEVFKNKGVGGKVLDGLKKEAANKGFDYELCLKPKPIVMNGQYFDSIVVTTDDDYLIASITSRDIIAENGTKVIVVPFDY